MGARLAIVAGVLIVALLAGVGYFLFAPDGGEQEQQQAEAPARPDGSAGQAGPEGARQSPSSAPEPGRSTGGQSSEDVAPQEQPSEPVQDEGSEPQRLPDPRQAEEVTSSPAGSDEPGVAEPPEPAPADTSRPAAGDEQSARLPAVQEPQPEMTARGAPSFDVVRVERDGSSVMAGRAEPGSTIILLRNGEEFGRTQADAAGEWVFIADRPLEPGDHELTLRALGRDGGERESSRLVVVSVPQPKLQMAETSSESGDAEPVGAAQPATQRGPVAIALDKAGEGDVVVLQGIDAGMTVGDLVLETLRYDAEGRLTVSGRVTPGSRVFAYIDNEFAGEAQGDAEGSWRLSPSEPVSLGLHRLRLDQVDEAGEVLARLETPFARSTLLTDLPEGERLVVVQPGNSLWRIAQRTYGQGLRYTVIFEANEQQIRDPDLIYPGQVFVVPEERLQTTQ